MKRSIFCLLFLTGFIFPLIGQPLGNKAIRQKIEEYKNDIRGPYKDIRWFCKNGSVIMPKEKCPEPGGVQRARYKDDVQALAKSNHIFLGQILSNTPKEDFWDADHYNSRLKQYQLEKYLRAVDDGWVLRKGQFYRGAFQIEDEEAWGIDFFTWLLEKDKLLESQFFLIRQAIKDIPHKGDNSKTLNVRAVSKIISDEYPAFMDLRVKIHGQPELSDIPKVKAFKEKHRSKLNAELMKKFDVLIADMEEVYQPVNLNELNGFLKNVPKDAPISKSLIAYIQEFREGNSDVSFAKATAEKIAEIRLEIRNVKSRKARLALMDISNALEEIFYVSINQWQPKTVKDAIQKVYYTGLAAMGTGFVETWEWNELAATLSASEKEEMSLKDLQDCLERSRGLIEWGTGMVNAVYKDVISLYSGFEPLAYGFFDDRIRGSVLLPLGNTVGELGNFIAQKSNLTNKVLNVPNQSTFRGLNPGFALGELVVVSEDESKIEINKDKIYIFHHPPADLKPVAGILTVTEGNLVSHVQLLARNLGIPNAVLSLQNMEWLKRFSRQKVFYAVSNSGTLIMKPAGLMTTEEIELFAVKARSDERITVPIEKMDLKQTSVLNMREVNATSSGKVCGPKAANLGQLKMLFPDNVVEGIVLPFGIFREHMNQTMPEQTVSYWTYLNQAFNKAKHMEKIGFEAEEVEGYILSELSVLRDAIKKMELMPAFVADLEKSFEQAFGKKPGEVPVFVRSDTNMEDLKDFTGAGLNLTLFNVVDKAKIIQGIKDVWASPYTERSFKWRQRYLLNPENVFPSILIIPSVDVDCSGVLITKGITTGEDIDLTIAFNRGAGGAVDGQAAESYLLDQKGKNHLLSPAREPTARRLPVSGGSNMVYLTFEKPVLNAQNLEDLRQLSASVRLQIPKSGGIETQGPFDVELGFKDNKLWLFQIRPFVENKNALSSEYLERISPKIDGQKMVKLDQPL